MTQRLDHKIPAVAIGVAASVTISIGGAVLGLNEQWRMPTPNETGMLTIAAAFYSVASYLLVLAFRGVELSVVSPFRYALLFWALIAGFILLGEVPDGWSMVGALIIVASGLYTLHREAVRRRNLTGDTPPQ
jgi:drug/metabolite transporter (DMT)-like permease